MNLIAVCAIAGATLAAIAWAFAYVFRWSVALEVEKLQHRAAMTLLENDRIKHDAVAAMLRGNVDARREGPTATVTPLHVVEPPDGAA